MTCQYCGSPLVPGATECQVCGEPIPSYGNSSAVDQQTSYSRQYNAAQSGTAQNSYSASGTQQYSAQNTYSSQYSRPYAQPYGTYPQQSYSQAGSYSAQNGYYAQYGQQYGVQASAGYAQNSGYGSHNGYYAQYGQQYTGQTAPSYTQSSGYNSQYGQQYGGQSAQSYAQNGGYGTQDAGFFQYGQPTAQIYSPAGIPSAMGGYNAGTQQYAMPGLNMYSMQDDSAHKDAPVEIAGRTFRSLVASPLFVICLILTSVSMILGTYIAFSGNVLSEYYQDSIDYDTIYEEYIEGSEFMEGAEFIENSELLEGSEYLEDFDADEFLGSGEDLETLVEDEMGLGSLDPIVGIIKDVSRSPLASVPLLFTSICALGDKINVIPHLLILIGLWVAFGTISSRPGIPFSTGGLTCIKVGLVFRTVVSCIIGGLIILVLLITTIAGTAFLSFIEELAALGGSVLLILLLTFVAYFVLRCIYYAKQTTTVNMVRTTAAQGVFNLRLSTYVIFWNFFLAALHLATAVFFYRSPMLLVRHLANAAVLVMFSVSMILYRKKTFELRDSSIQVYM